MITLKRCLVIPAAILAMIAMATDAAAQCHSCAAKSGSFGYPTGASAGCGCGAAGGAAVASGHHGTGFGAFDSVKAGIEQYKDDYRIAHARNSAWPQPFSCWDRAAYYNMFNQQYAQGLEAAHLLTSRYFDTETNELNRAGEQRVAWIMQMSTKANKKIFLYEDQSSPTLNRRLAAVRDFTDRYYRHLGNVQIAKSQVLPHQIPSAYQAVIAEQYSTGQPAPIIPVTSGATINESVGN